MPLPTCQCVAGLPTQQQLGFIYCALLDILAASGGGSITVSQISDMTAFWKAAVVTTPAAETYLTSNGAQAFAAVPFANISIAAAQINDASPSAIGLITTLPTPAGKAFVTIDNTNLADTIVVGFSGNGLTSVDVSEGIVTAGT